MRKDALILLTTICAVFAVCGCKDNEKVSTPTKTMVRPAVSSASKTPEANENLPKSVDVIAILKGKELPKCLSNAVMAWDNCYGKGVLPNGTKIEGEFQKGSFVFGILSDKSQGMVLKGHFHDMSIYGIGEIDDPDGARFVCNFVDSRCEGHGISFVSDGSSEGYYKHQVPQGVFVQRDAQGEPIGTKTFRNGKLVAQTNRAEDACRRAVMAEYYRAEKEIRWHLVRFEVPEEFMFTYGLSKTGAFRNHPFVRFAASIAKYEDGRFADRINTPTSICVMGDHYEVISLETTEDER